MTLREAPIADITETIIDYRGKTPPKSASGIRLLTAKVIKDGTIDESRLEYISDDTYSSWMRRGFPRKRDILITTEAPLGETAILRDHERVALAQRVILLRGDARVVDQEYLFAAIRSPLMQSRLRQRATGTTVLGIKQSELRQVLVPLPPLSTQRKIAAIVSAYDDLIENNARRVKLLEEIARRLYREWFIDFRYPGHENVPLMPSDSGLIPEDWGWRALGSLAEDVRSRVEPRAVHPDTPYIGLEHLPQRSIAIGEWATAADAGSSKLAFEVGDVLFGRIRPYFHKVAAPPVAGICSTDAIVIRARVPEFTGLVLAIVSSDAFVEQAVQTSQGTKMPRANWKVLEGYSVALPHQELLVKFDGVMSDTVDMIHRLVIAIRTLRATRDLLLPPLISGDVDVERLDIQVPAVA